MTTYVPRGDGHCAECGHDVSHHNGGHKYVECGCADCDEAAEFGRLRMCGHPDCYDFEDHPIHDVGRVLMCPEEAGA